MTDHDPLSPPPSPWGKRPDNNEEDRRPSSPRRRNSSFSKFLIGVIVFLVTIVLLAWLLPDLTSSQGMMGGLLYDGLLLAFVGAGLWAHVASSPGRALRHMATWVIIFGILALGYSIWTGTGRLSGELDSAKGFDQGNSISYRADMSGHYFVIAKVNNIPIRFMVDTGASDVALTRKDAEKIGFRLNSLKYNMPYNTANGMAYGARVRLNKISLGPITAQNVSGAVLNEGLDYSLLGMSFLQKLKGYKVVDGVLTLYP